MSRHARSVWQAGWRIAWLLVCAGLAAGARADDPVPDTRDDAAPPLRVKAGYLYKFGAFVEWPGRAFGSADAPLVIGVLEADALADELALVVGGRSVQGRPIAVRRLRAGDPVTGVHVLYLGRGASARPPDDLPLLTVADDRRRV